MSTTSSSVYFPKGSEWRIWDFHAHTWISHNFSGDRAASVNQINNAEAEVVGVNDYFSLAGYVDLVGSGEIQNKVLLPVVELRMINVLTHKRAGTTGERLNFHLIFNPAIIDRAQGFLDSLMVQYKDATKRPLSTLDPGEYEHAQVDFVEVLDSLQTQGIRSDTLVVLPYDEYGGIDDIDPNTDNYLKSYLTIRADIMGSARQKQIDFFLWKDPRLSVEEYREYLRVPKPCIKGSDSHEAAYPLGRLRDKDSKPSGRFCWIKADPTFEGLRQVVFEPEERVHIGARPEKLNFVSSHPDLFVGSLKINSIDRDSEWFDDVGTICFSTDLVAIIGNKGSGKSALADLLAAAGNATNNTFSFLQSKKFLDHPAHEKYSAEILFQDGYRGTKDASSPDHDITLPAKVVYLPQNYVADLCEAEDVSKLKEEVHRVIFAHVPEEDRLGQESLEELTQELTRDLEPRLSELRDKISVINRELVRLEAKLEVSYRARVANDLIELRRQLDAIPTEVAAVVEAGEPDVAADSIVNSLQKRLAERTRLQESLQEELNASRIDQQNVIKLQSSIETLRRDIEEINASEAANIVKTCTNDSSDLVTISIESDRMVLALGSIAAKIDQVRRIQALSQELFSRDQALFSQANDSLTSAQREADRKRREREEATLRRTRLLGVPESEGTIMYLEAELEFIDSGLNASIDSKRRERSALTRLIVDRIFEQRSRLANIFQPAQEYSNTRSREFNIPRGDVMGFRAGMKLSSDFGSTFLETVNQARRGTFYSTEDGHVELQAILEAVVAEDRSSVAGLPVILEEALWVNRRATARDNPQPRVDQIETQLLVSKEDFYDFLYSMRYLTFDYELIFGGKDIDILSPGERGMLLLMFYLLVDTDRRPLIIDQPEENLDNETVFQRLVPFIKHVKKERQLFIVTHNPNLAVVCDAEQIIHCSIDKEHRNVVSYASGSIEHDQIRAAAIDVLEGTPPAFVNRKDKYSATLRLSS